MRAVVIDGFGTPEVLRVAEVPMPEPGDGEVLVRVHAAGVNAIDWATRAGQGVSVDEFPAVLGWDISGTVAGLGAGVSGFREGDRVFGMPSFPTLAKAYAEYVVAPADAVARVPDGVADHVAAGVPMVALTAWQTLFTHGGLTKGQRVLVHGASGGVGHVAVQLAKWAGAEVVGTASAGNHDFVTEMGADRVVSYAEMRNEAGVDLVVDPRGGDDFTQLLDVLRPGGIIVTLKGEADGQRTLAQTRGVRAGFTYVGPDSAALAEIASLLGGGQLTVAVQQVLPLAEVIVAHEVGERGHVRGRLVLEVT